MSVVLSLFIGVLSCLLYTVFLLMIARPKINFSPHITFSSESSSGKMLSIKVVNGRPWSLSGLEFGALAVVRRQEKLEYVPIVVMNQTQPVMGGWARAERRQSRWGWLGASHRVLRLTVPNWEMESTTWPRDLEEILVWVRATDGALFSLTTVTGHTYRMANLVEGEFEKGRALRVSPTGVAEAAG